MLSTDDQKAVARINLLDAFKALEKSTANLVAAIRSQAPRVQPAHRLHNIDALSKEGAMPDKRPRAENDPAPSQEQLAANVEWACQAYSDLFFGEEQNPLEVNQYPGLIEASAQLIELARVTSAHRLALKTAVGEFTKLHPRHSRGTLIGRDPAFARDPVLAEEMRKLRLGQLAVRHATRQINIIDEPVRLATFSIIRSSFASRHYTPAQAIAAAKSDEEREILTARLNVQAIGATSSRVVIKRSDVSHFHNATIRCAKGDVHEKSASLPIMVLKGDLAAAIRSYAQTQRYAPHKGKVENEDLGFGWMLIQKN